MFKCSKRLNNEAFVLNIEKFDIRICSPREIISFYEITTLSYFTGVKNLGFSA